MYLMHDCLSETPLSFGESRDGKDRSVRSFDIIELTNYGPGEEIRTPDVLLGKPSTDIR